VAAGLVLLIGLGGCGGASAGAGGNEAVPVPLHGVRPLHPVERPDVTLRDTGGAPYNIAERTKGRPTYLFFAFTSCPDECPTALSDLAAALRSAPAEQRSQAQVVVVTTDPARDTGPVLRRYLDRFDPAFVGLTGTTAQVEAAQRAAQVPIAERVDAAEPGTHPHAPGTGAHSHPAPAAGGYDVAHSAALLAYDRSDRVRVIYPTGVLPEDLAADLPLLLEEEPSS